MASPVSVCNQALLLAGVARRISSLTESSAEAVAVSTALESAVSGFLRAFEWPWATKRTALVATTVPALGVWTLAYALPANCAKAIRLEPGTGSAIPTTAEGWLVYRFALGAGDTGTVLLTDAPSPVLVYTDASVVVDRWSEDAADALALRVAADVAVALGKDLALRDRLLRDFAMALNEAKRTARRDMAVPVPPADAEAISSRGW